MLQGEDRIKADRMWRDHKSRTEFEAATGLTDEHTEEYHHGFVEWAEIKLRCPYKDLSGPGGHCSYPKCDAACAGRHS